MALFGHIEVISPSRSSRFVLTHGW